MGEGWGHTMKPSKPMMAPIILGNSADPLTDGGGLILLEPDQVWSHLDRFVLYWTSGFRSGAGQIERIEIPDDVFSRYDWTRPFKASHDGSGRRWTRELRPSEVPGLPGLYDENMPGCQRSRRLRSASVSPDPRIRAILLTMLSTAYSWISLDSQRGRMSQEEFLEQWSEAKNRYSKVPALPPLEHWTPIRTVSRRS
jgi:hypothetical protein